MAISLVGTAGNQGSGTAVTSASITLPSAVAAGDVVFVGLQINSGASDTVTFPSGWSQVGTTLPSLAGVSIVGSVWMHVQQSGDPTSITVNFASSTAWYAASIAYSGVDNTTPIDTFAQSSSKVTGTAITAPTVTTNYADDQLVYFLMDTQGSSSGANFSDLSGATTLEADGANNHPGIFDENQASAAASAARTFTVYMTGNMAAITIGLVPSGATALVGTNGNQSGSAATSATVNFPTNVAAGDLILIALNLVTTATVTPPSGWTQVGTNLPGINGPSGFILTIWQHIYQSGDGTSATFNFSSAIGWSGASIAYSGVNTTTPIDTSAQSASEATGVQSINAPQITTGNANEQIVYWIVTELLPQWVAPAGTVYEVAGQNRYVAGFDENQASAGLSAVRNFPLAVSTGLAAMTVALKPASGASAQTITPATLSDESIGATTAKGVASAIPGALADESIGAPSTKSVASAYPASLSAGSIAAPAAIGKASAFVTVLADESLATPAVRAIARAVASAIADEMIAAPNLTVPGSVAITLLPISDESLAAPGASARSSAIVVTLASSAIVAPVAEAIAKIDPAALFDESAGPVVIYVVGGGIVVCITLGASPALNITLDASPALNIGLGAAPALNITVGAEVS